MKWLDTAIFGFIAAVIAVIVFVKAGPNGGQSGGEQTAQVITASGGALASLATSLEGGGDGSK